MLSILCSLLLNFSSTTCCCIYMRFCGLCPAVVCWLVFHANWFSGLLLLIWVVCHIYGHTLFAFDITFYHFQTKHACVYLTSFHDYSCPFVVIFHLNIMLIFLSLTIKILLFVYVALSTKPTFISILETCFICSITTHTQTHTLSFHTINNWFPIQLILSSSS